MSRLRKIRLEIFEKNVPPEGLSRGWRRWTLRSQAVISLTPKVPEKPGGHLMSLINHGWTKGEKFQDHLPTQTTHRRPVNQTKPQSGAGSLKQRRRRVWTKRRFCSDLFGAISTGSVRLIMTHSLQMNIAKDSRIGGCVLSSNWPCDSLFLLF